MVKRLHAEIKYNSPDGNVVSYEDYEALEAELMALSQDDGKVERALEAAQARITQLEAEKRAYEMALTTANRRIAELDPVNGYAILPALPRGEQHADR